MLKSLCRLKRIQTARGLEFVADVAEAESCPVDADIFSECDDFKQFAHFMLVNQFLNSGGFTDIGCRICFTRLCQQFGYAQIQQKMGLGQIACQIQSCIRTGLGNVGKIDVGGQICQPDEVERIVDNVVSVVSDQCALIALRVVILRRIKTVVDEYHTPAFKP